MSKNFPAALDYLGKEAEEFCPAHNLYLKPLAIIKITVSLPKMTIPGQSISNWDLMEKLKKAVDPIQMDSIKVRESNVDSVIFEAELLSIGIMKKAMSILDTFAMKVSGFAEPLRVKTKEAKQDFPSRHDWDLWFMKNKMDETKPGERPDTIYLAKVPVKWFNEGKGDLPSEKMLKEAFEVFGPIRTVDIPICDPLRLEMSSKISGIQQKGFGLGQDIFFEAYVQFMEYKGFATAMDSLRNRKWAKRIDGRFFQAHVKVDFDKTRHLSQASIDKRFEAKRKIENERIKKENEEKKKKLEEEMRRKKEQEEKDRRREEREKRRREKRELERLQEEERRKKEKFKKETEQRALASRKSEALRLLKHIFSNIEAKEERRKRKEEEKLKEELKQIENLEDQPVEKEEALRHALLVQRELRMRERLKEKLEAAVKENEKQKKSKSKHKSKRRDSSSESDSSSLTEFGWSSEEERRRKRRSLRNSRNGQRRRYSEESPARNNRRRSHSSSDSYDHKRSRNILEEVRRQTHNRNEQTVDAIWSSIDVLTKVLTSKEMYTKIDPIIEECDPVSSIILLTSVISKTRKIPFSKIRYLVNWVQLIIAKNVSKFIESQLDAPADDDFRKQSNQEFAVAYLSLPGKISNYRAIASSSKDQEIIDNCTKALENSLVSALETALESAIEKIGSSSCVNLELISFFLTKGRNLRIEEKKSNLLSVIFEWICEKPKDNLKWDRIAQRMFTDESCGVREFEALSTNIAILAKNCDQLERCFGGAIKTSVILNRVITVKVIFQRILPFCSLAAILDYIHRFLKEPGILKVLEMAIQVWINASFIRAATIEQYRHTTRVLLYCFYILKNDPSSKVVWATVFAKINDGIHERISNSDLEIRQTGMFIGETLSRFVDVVDEKVLNFDYKDDEWLNEMRGIIEKGYEPEPKKTEDNVTSNLTHVQEVPSYFNHLPTPPSLRETSEAVDSDDDDDFPVYEIPEEEKQFQKLRISDEPLKKADPPKYIADAFEQLHEKERYEVFEAALSALEDMIKRNALGFPEIATRLAVRLLYLDDKFSTPNFEEIRKNCIVACMVQKPSVVPDMINVMLSADPTVTHRFLVLECIRNAAKELCKPKEIVLKANNTGGINEEGKDNILLSRIIFTACEVFSYAGLCPKTPQMAVNLIEFVAPLRYFEETNVRISVMFAHCTVMELVPEEILLTIFSTDAINIWFDWARSSFENPETNEHERKLASCVMNEVINKIKHEI
ncbi:unnamed protein product [Caenorhabditis bovis]|uniref:Telomere length regulation protein conserved domain-containing protein n=1 Tax=Caenorhabditis bovis TaxID=2654633 RepID=A0A8S1ES39_9PELO|nr:unnamed protein product [Caenorhabditis bovis]